ncbi:MAG TPA: AAA family ATPase [Terriglobales bacterium]|nr:AAA family ATPase [Terriglobales bacterium]
MRIDSIDLIRYGHFSDRSLDFSSRQPDFFVIYGDNEAGKSTLLRAISALFFGVPAKTPDAHSCKGSELRIGATASHGRERLSFRRRKGTTATLLDGRESQIQENALGAFLPELDRDRFEQFFCLDHQRLREGGEELLRGKGDVGSALFQAAGLLELRKLLESLEDEAKQLFSAKARGRVINSLVDEYKDARSELRRLAISAVAVKEMESELEHAQAHHEALNTEAQTLQQELVKLRRIASNKPDVARLQELRSALVALDSVPVLPPTARRQRDEAAAALSSANREIQSLGEQIAQRRERIRALPLSAELNPHGNEIEELTAGIADYLRGVNDRPKRLHDRDEAIHRAELEWKEIWRKHSISEAESLKSVYSRKTEILELMTEHARLSTALEQAAEQFREARDTQETLGEELAHDPSPPDPAMLIATIEAAKSLGDTDGVVAGTKSEIERLNDDAARELRGLALWQGSIQELEALKTPLPATIERYAREWESIQERRKERHLQGLVLADAIRDKQAELELYRANVGKASETELLQARVRRDRLWEIIRSSVFGNRMSLAQAQQESQASSPLPTIFEQQLRSTDEIADLRFTHAKDVAVHDRLVKEIHSARQEEQRVGTELARLDSDADDLRRRWASEWMGLPAEPLSPAEMREWMQSRQRIIERVAQARHKEDEVGKFQVRLSIAASEMRERMRELGLPAETDGGSLPLLIRVAEARAKELSDRRRKTQDLRQRLALLQLEKREAKLEECKRNLSVWAGKWTPLVKALLLPEISTPKAIGGALEVLEKVFGHLRDADALEYRIKRIGDNIDSFERKARELLQVLAPELAKLSPNLAVRQLHERYVESGKAETERDAMERENDTDERTIAECRARADAAAATLAALLRLAKCSDDQQLEATLQASEQKSAKQEEHERIARGLIERNALPDLAQIEHEASAFDLDSLKSEILRREERQRELESELFNAASEFGRLSQEFERLQASEESALQAQKAEDALAKLRPALAQHLRLRFASEILARAMESYREKHQGPVLQRASELFSCLTLGDHSGLTTAFADEDKPVLVAVRHNNQHVEVAGLSDGTRDQLYLALRLAAIEDHVARVAPCPVILDDILINSDDVRASAALQVLGDLAQRTQVLFFTHHSRLAELATRSGAQVVQLSASVAVAVA